MNTPRTQLLVMLALMLAIFIVAGCKALPNVAADKIHWEHHDWAGKITIDATKTSMTEVNGREQLKVEIYERQIDYPVWHDTLQMQGVTLREGKP